MEISAPERILKHIVICRPSSHESPNKTSYLFASVSLLNMNISSVAAVLRILHSFLLKCLHTAVFLKDLTSKSNLFSFLVSSGQKQSFKMLSDTLFDASRDPG